MAGKSVLGTCPVFPGWKHSHDYMRCHRAQDLSMSPHVISDPHIRKVKGQSSYRLSHTEVCFSIMTKSTLTSLWWQAHCENTSLIFIQYPEARVPKDMVVSQREAIKRNHISFSAWTLKIFSFVLRSSRLASTQLHPGLSLEKGHVHCYELCQWSQGAYTADLQADQAVLTPASTGDQWSPFLHVLAPHLTFRTIFLHIQFPPALKKPETFLSDPLPVFRGVIMGKSQLQTKYN